LHWNRRKRAMPVTTTHSFGVLLKQLRKRAGMTQRDLAAALNYSDSLISSLEHAQRLPDLHAVLNRFIPALGLQDDPTTATRLIEQAALACGERPGDLVTLHHATHAMLQDESAARAVQLLSSPNELIGRAEEVRQVCNRLRGHSGRLLTLVGPPGIGKTRLALAVAARMHRHYPDGAVFVPLAAITDPTVMASTIAVAVGSNNASAKPPTMRLIEALRHKSMLLLLDNCEQLIGASPLVAEVLAACPGICVLATSRERLHLRAEQRYRVPSLDLAAAVDLFAQRAAAVDADFAVTAANRSTIEAICERLDRLPLALELCAAQVDLLAPSQILKQLHAHPLDLLVDGAHDLPLQHRTLRNAIQRSYDLLADDERVLFRRLGVFVGGCDLAAVETVCAWQAETPTRSLLATLHGLVGKSLVRAEPTLTGESRFLLLETIREYALERLAQCAEEDRLRQQQASFFLTLAEAAESHLQGPKQVDWLNRLEAEHDNFRAALAWSQAAAGDANVGLQLVAALWWFWRRRGHVSEGRRWIAAALAAARDGWPNARVNALIGAGQLAGYQNESAQAQVLVEEALTLARTHGDRRGAAAALNLLGWCAVVLGDNERAVISANESLALSQDLADTCGIAEALRLVGWIAWRQGNYARATKLMEESLALNRALDNTEGIAWLLMYLGTADGDQGAYGRATARLEESRLLFRQLGDKNGIASSISNLAHSALGQGHYEQAAALAEESLALCRDLGDKYGIVWSSYIQGAAAHRRGHNAWAVMLFTGTLTLCWQLGWKDLIPMCFEGIAWVAVARGQAGRAARLFGAAEALREVMTFPKPPPLIPAERTKHDRAVSAARAQLDEATFTAAWAEGRTMSLEQAIAYTLEE
jgi:predicted ATPase/transcriptional regulator with XRE-family HTH domain